MHVGNASTLLTAADILAGALTDRQGQLPDGVFDEDVATIAARAEAERASTSIAEPAPT